MIKISNLTKTYKNLTAVANLSLEVGEGEIFGFIGPNGAGKTTTIRVLATLTLPTSGSAEIAGYNVLTQPDDVKRVLGYMPDNFGVYEDLKVWEYLDFFAAAYRLPKATRPGVIEKVLALTDLTHKRDDFVEALSKGMKQRLCLAKTLVHDPKVLLLDEPASGLDPRARIELRDLLRELSRMGKTIIVSSHILTELADLCTSVGIIERGKLLRSGRVQTIVSELRGGHCIIVRLRENAEAAREVLLTNPMVTRVVAEESTLDIYLAPECTDHSFIAEVLVRNGLRILGIRERDVNLEQAFMQITTGAVQ